LDDSAINRESMVAPHENAFNLRGEEQATVGAMPIEGLDSQPIPRQPQGACVLIEPGQAPHAVESLEGPLAPGSECLEHDLGVTAGMKLDPKALEIAAQLKVVVYFPVVDQYLAAGRRHHRMMPGDCQILNGETDARERDPVAAHSTEPAALSIGATVGLCVHHLAQRDVER